MPNRLFAILAAALAPRYRGVAPFDVPPPSVWAEQHLGFRAEPKQRDVLDHDAHRFVLCAARQWGKTTVIGLKALHTALFQPNQQIVVISPTLKQAAVLMNRIQRHAAALGHPRRRILGHAHSVAFANGSRILAVAAVEDKVRGYTADIVFVDDAAFVSDEVIGVALAALARTNGRLWLLGTPNRQYGLFYDLWHHKASPLWCQIKATIEDMPSASAEFIAEQKRLFPDDFRRDFLCEFAPRPGQLISRETLQSMLRPDLDPPFAPGEDNAP
jgi:hypothetical protein